MKTRLSERCEWEDCKKKATTFASGHEDRYEGRAGSYCDEHAEWIADEGGPEYTASCPNCGCMFGVN